MFFIVIILHILFINGIIIPKRQCKQQIRTKVMMMLKKLFLLLPSFWIMMYEDYQYDKHEIKEIAMKIPDEIDYKLVITPIINDILRKLIEECILQMQERKLSFYIITELEDTCLLEIVVKRLSEIFYQKGFATAKVTIHNNSVYVKLY